jgi:hypothetical protein
MEKTFQYQQQIFAGLELEIYNHLLKTMRFFYSAVPESYYNYPNGVVSYHLTDLRRGRSVGGGDSESVDLLRKYNAKTFHL